MRLTCYLFSTYHTETSVFPTSVAFSPDGKTLVSGDDHNISFWNPSTGQRKGTVKAHKGGVDALAFSSDGKFLASGGFDKSVKIWEVATTKFESKLFQHEAPIHSVAFSPDEKKTGSGTNHEQFSEIILAPIETPY